MIVIGYIMSIHHHYGLFNSQQTFDLPALIYHEQRQTNLRRATLREGGLLAHVVRTPGLPDMSNAWEGELDFHVTARNKKWR